MMEQRLKVPEDHVIVDREEWEEANRIISEPPYNGVRDIIDTMRYAPTTKHRGMFTMDPP